MSLDIKKRDIFSSPETFPQLTTLTPPEEFLQHRPYQSKNLGKIAIFSKNLPLKIH